MGCGREGRYLCGACLEQATPLHDSYRPDHVARADEAGATQGQALEVYAPFAFEGVIRDAVHTLKYQGLQAIAQPIGQLMADHALRHGLDADVVMPVPLHTVRVRERGYNQAESLAREVAKALDLPTDTRTLRRVRHTNPQVKSASLEERRAQVEDAFHAAGPLAGVRVLVVDDVCTSGATLAACARALLQSGAGSVVAVTAARDL